MCVKRLAEGAATGTSASLRSWSAVVWFGILIPMLPVPAERMEVVSS